MACNDVHALLQASGRAAVAAARVRAGAESTRTQARTGTSAPSARDHHSDDACAPPPSAATTSATTDSSWPRTGCCPPARTSPSSPTAARPTPRQPALGGTCGGVGEPVDHSGVHQRPDHHEQPREERQRGHSASRATPWVSSRDAPSKTRSPTIATTDRSRWTIVCRTNAAVTAVKPPR